MFHKVPTTPVLTVFHKVPTTPVLTVFHKVPTTPVLTVFHKVLTTPVLTVFHKVLTTPVLTVFHKVLTTSSTFFTSQSPDNFSEGGHGGQALVCPLEVQDGVSRRVWVIPLMGEGEQDRSGGGVCVGGRGGGGGRDLVIDPMGGVERRKWQSGYSVGKKRGDGEGGCGGGGG